MKTSVAQLEQERDECQKAMECACCFQMLGSGSVALLPCGHIYCNREPCPSAHAAACPECRQAVAGRVVLFGALANVESALAGAAAGSGAR